MNSAELFDVGNNDEGKCIFDQTERFINTVSIPKIYFDKYIVTGTNSFRCNHIYTSLYTHFWFVC